MAGIFSFGEQSRTPVTLLLHISSETDCKGAILAFESHPRIIYSTASDRASRSQPPKGDADRLRSSVSSVVHELLSYLVRYGEGKAHRVSRIVCMLPTEHATTRAKLVRSNQREPFEVTASFVMSLLKQADHSEHSGAKTHQSGASNHPPLLSRDIVAIKVNGYDTTNPFGKIGTELEIALSETSGDAKAVTAIRTAIVRHSAAPIVFRSASLAVFFVVRNALSPAQDFLLLIGGEEATELMLVRRGGVSDQLSFPLGSSSIVKELAEGLGTTVEGVSAALSLYWLSKLASAEGKKLEKALGEMRPAWLLSFEKAVAELSEDSLLPPKLFVIGSGNNGKLFPEFLRPGSFAGETLATGRFETIVLDHGAFRTSSLPKTAHDIDLEPLLESEYLAMTRETSSYPQFSSARAVIQ